MFTVKDSPMLLKREEEERIGELRNLSELARRVFLHRRCEEIRYEVDSMLKNRTTFIADLTKSLSKVTGEWRAWNHEIFGGVRTMVFVASIAQVDELLTWTENTCLVQSTVIKHRNSSESYRRFITKTLRSFLDMCTTMKQIEKKLNDCVAVPLRSFFNDFATTKYMLQLDNVQGRWRGLLSPGAINADFFSHGSIKLLKDAEGLPNFNNFYVVLRLIPDLRYKSHECLELIRLCLDAEDIQAYRRETNFLMRNWLPKQRKDIDAKEKQELNIKIPKIIDQCVAKDLQLQEKRLELRTRARNTNTFVEKLRLDERSLERQLKEHHTERDHFVKSFEDLSKEKWEHESRIISLRGRISSGKRDMRQNVWSRYNGVEGLENMAYLRLKERVVENLNNFHSAIKQLEAVDKRLDHALSVTEKMDNLIFQRSFQLKEIREKKDQAVKFIQSIEAEEDQSHSDSKDLRLQVNALNRKLQQISKDDRDMTAALTKDSLYWVRREAKLLKTGLKKQHTCLMAGG